MGDGLVCWIVSRSRLSCLYTYNYRCPLSIEKQKNKIFVVGCMYANLESHANNKILRLHYTYRQVAALNFRAKNKMRVLFSHSTQKRLAKQCFM